MKKKSLYLFLFLLILPGCLYKTPTQEDICVLPQVNNPTVTRERGPSLSPKI